MANIIVGIVLIILGVIAGIGLLFVKIDEESFAASSKMVPWAQLFRSRAIVIVAAALCFLLAVFGLIMLVSGFSNK